MVWRVVVLLGRGRLAAAAAAVGLAADGARARASFAVRVRHRDDRVYLSAGARFRALSSHRLVRSPTTSFTHDQTADQRWSWW